jgi:protein-S-isoprenylcysteine O-methyltransferase Ste14
MVRSLGGIATACLGVVLLGFAMWRWRENGLGAAIWLAAFVATLAIRAPHSIRNRRNLVVADRKGLVEMMLLSGMFATMMVFPLLQLATGVFDFANYTLPRWATWVGIVLQVPYLWLFWRSHEDLGRNWSPGLEVRENHGLVTSGIYARIRHPMYAAIWLSALAQPLLIQNWIAGMLVVAAFGATWFIRIPNEEAMMRKQFGSAYDVYCLRTGRLFPKFGR